MEPFSRLFNWHKKDLDERSFGDRLADFVAEGMGSWRFIILQTIVVAFWITINLIAYAYHWDPYPFILLNLVFSTQAAYAAPIIMMAQNRQADRDRIQANADYQTNIQAKEEIDEIQSRLSRIETEKLDRILELLQTEKKTRTRAPRKSTKKSDNEAML